LKGGRALATDSFLSVLNRILAIKTQLVQKDLICFSVEVPTGPRESMTAAAAAAGAAAAAAAAAAATAAAAASNSL
jgi:hypothetical protein